MQEGWWTAVKRFILWDYNRGSLAYDLMVGLILAFIFFTPRDLFRDQPTADQIVMLPSQHGSSVFYVEPSLLEGVPEDQMHVRAEELIYRSTSGGRLRVSHIEPMFDSAEQVTGYMAFTTP